MNREVVRIESSSMPQIRNWNSIGLRPATAEDGGLLLELFKSSRGGDLREIGWDEDRIGEFLDMQFEAQQRLDQSEYQQADDQIVLREGKTAGPLSVHRPDHHIPSIHVPSLPPPPTPHS